MSGKVALTITAGAMQGKEFVFDRHDTLLVGRMDDCQVYLPDDKQISRHHCILEVNPPNVCVRDLGSLHGTYINKQKYGGREKYETPEEGAKYQHPTITLHDGDEIKLGKTHIHVAIAVEKGNGEPVHCQRCGKDVMQELGSVQQGDYLCEDCRQKELEAGDLLLDLLRKAVIEQQAQQQNATAELRIPDYEVERRLGRGGMGDVYLVRNLKDNSKAALKVMIAKIAVQSDARERFLREIQITTALNHQNIVRLIDSGAVGSLFYFLLEYCDGGSLDKAIEKHGGHLPLATAVPIMLQTLEGLGYIHAQGIVHRDLKPQNILLNGKIAKVADMGLAKHFDQAGFSGMTVTGTIIGSFAFMPREQVVDFKHFEPTSDVWAIAATFYNMLTGRYPRDVRKGQDPIEMILHNDIVPLRKRDSRIPVALADVIDRALANNVKDRYQTTYEFQNALTKALVRAR